MPKRSSRPSLRGFNRRDEASSPPDDEPGRPCDKAGCVEAGMYRAPKGRDRLNEYYWFCMDHVREYNRAWNYCAGMSDTEIEAMIRSDMVGGRPTWPLGRLGGYRVRLDEMEDSFSLFEEDRKARAEARARAREHRHTAGSEHEARALELMELTPPLTPMELKARYKELVKRHHPDANGGDKAAEERLKLINQAYATLKERLGA